MARHDGNTTLHKFRAWKCGVSEDIRFGMRGNEGTLFSGEAEGERKAEDDRSQDFVRQHGPAYREPGVIPRIFTLLHSFRATQYQRG